MTASQRVETVVVGVGFSGIAVAHDLLAAGREDFVLLERADAVGGVWRDNVYPNAACDVPAHLYSLSFAQSAEWSSNYAPQAEIQAYQERVVDALGIRERIRFRTSLVRGVWDAAAQEWALELDDGSTMRCRFLVSAIGTLNQPLVPELPGRDAYRGQVVHTAEWHDGVDLRGKRVAVVGAGASAVQVVPAAVEAAEAVLVSIRTAPHIMPKPEELYGEAEKQRFRDHPEVLRALRREQYDFWNRSTHAQAIMDEEFLQEAERAWRAHMEAAIDDPALRDLLTPTSRFGCRRPVVSNAFYPALARPSTTVTPHGIVGLTGQGVLLADGSEWSADVVVLATGFRATEMFDSVELVGADGETLVDAWRDGPAAFRGTLVRGFPNLFLMTGPNTQASGSIIGVIEAQADYVVRLMALADDAAAVSVEATDAAQAEFDADLERMMARSVWEVGGCESWYKVGMSGRVAIKWPGSLAEFERTLDELVPEHYVLAPARRSIGVA